MKPKIGTIVYCIYTDSITKFKVGYVGKDGFIIDAPINGEVVYEALLWRYEDFNTTWFKSLKKAESALLEGYPDAKIKKIDDDYWEIEE